MDVVSTQYFLGIRPVLKGLLIDPYIPKEWDKFTVSGVFRGCEPWIEVVNPDKVQRGVKEVTVNGKKIEGATITPEFLASFKEANVKVVMR